MKDVTEPPGARGTRARGQDVGRAGHARAENAASGVRDDLVGETFGVQRAGSRVEQIRSRQGRRGEGRDVEVRGHEIRLIEVDPRGRPGRDLGRVQVPRGRQRHFVARIPERKRSRILGTAVALAYVRIEEGTHVALAVHVADGVDPERAEVPLPECGLAGRQEERGIEDNSLAAC